jgi:dephospho-CoA kinase
MLGPMILIGLTGGVGMGKTTAADWFAAQGVPVADTDRIARALVEPGQEALLEVVARFGSGILAADGSLNRERLAQVVFADPAARQALEAILHPRIRSAWIAQAAAWREEGRAVGVVVIPLLFETRAEVDCDRTLCVACTAATQSLRLDARGWTRDESQRRIAAQWAVADKMARADWVVWSEGSLSVLHEQLARLLRGLRG